MAHDNLDALLKRMGDIATAVNAFASESVQREAFAALLNALNTGVPTVSVPPALEDAQSGAASTGGATADGVGRSPRKGKAKPKGERNSRTGFTLVKDLNLRPAGKKSFADFIAEKQPKSNQDRFAVVVCYFEQVIEQVPVTIDHVGSVFRLTEGWREPSDLAGALAVTSTRKGTIDTSDLRNLKTTPQGRNFVDHDLPAKKGDRKK